MGLFGPLVFASVVATLTSHGLISDPIYAIPHFQLHSNWEVLPYLLLGLLAGLLAPWFLRLLDLSERLAGRVRMPLYLKMCLGGLIVGALAVLHSEVCGNGYLGINTILARGWAWGRSCSRC
ncbi:MAG TPA: chloride channel protein [Terriglobales bacterium]|nr:chloride channel protein [Terriglobales bacterium]